MQSKKEKKPEGKSKPKNIVLERLKHLSWWGWSTGLNSSTTIKQF